jgi:protein-glutamine gamma-glutamyltransferase
VALAHRGISRAPSMPPLRHAEHLEASHHPLADEVLSLTHVYLATRFGGAVLSEASKADFERRVRQIRAMPAPEFPVTL